MAALSNSTYGKAPAMPSKDDKQPQDDPQPAPDAQDDKAADAPAPEVSSDPRERAEQAAQAAEDDKD